MGPVLRAVVGDTLKVTLKNMLPAGGASVSLHPHGVLYDKSSEGSPYADGLPREPPAEDPLALPAVCRHSP
jgi:hephaestin